MLAAAARLRNRDDFTATVRGGRRVSRGAVVVHMKSPDPAPIDDAPSSRAGFVVSKEVGGAVVRNQVKRRLRHLVRPHLAALPPGTDLVVRALPAAATRGFAGLQTDLDAAIGAAQRGDSDRRRRPDTDRRGRR